MWPSGKCPGGQVRGRISGTGRSYYEVPIDGERGWRQTENGYFQTMRFLKAIYLSVLFTLAMGLFCGELPESMRLQDDTSNDYVADSSASATHEMEVVQNATVANKGVAVQTARTSRSNSEIAAKPVTSSGQELLQLLSIRRT